MESKKLRSRKELYELIEKERNSKLLVFYTGDKPGMETKIASPCIPKFVDQLDAIGDVPKISLLIDTNGGDVIASWNIINLIRQFCKELEVIVPLKAMSGGTLMCLAAHSIIMTKQATLGPIDPSILTPFNPTVDGKPVYVGVEDIRGYLDFARKEVGIKDDASLSDVFNVLSGKIHPLVLGYTYRSLGQIRMLADKLLSSHISDKEKREKLVSFLCGGTANHNYTIDRREAKELGLNIIKPTQEFYKVLKETSQVLRNTIDADRSFSLDHYVNHGNNIYSIKRLLIESLDGGSDFFLCEGKVTGKMKKGQIVMPNKKPLINKIYFEDWRHKDEIE